MLIAAIYARKSTDQKGIADEAGSMARQVRGAGSFIEENGWTVCEEYILQDDGVSGAEFEARTGFMRLMSALTPKAPFDVLVVADVSRLGREQFETGYALKQLSQAGVRVFSYLERREIRLDTPMEKFLMSAGNFAGEVERDKARQRTYDAMVQKAKAGHVTGGRVFGYDNVPVEVTGPDGLKRRSHVEHRINESEAAVVLHMFELRAQGVGVPTIAKRLNADHTPTPRPQQGRPPGWAPSSVREVLLRDRYRGRIVWNRTKKRNKWGATQPSNRPEKEWIEVPMEHLRIVSEELWESVQRQCESARRRSLGAGGGKGLGRPPGAGAKYLLAGLASCSKCGASIEARTRAQGRRRVVFYGCSAYHRKGKHVCDNALTMPANILEDAVLQAVEAVVLDPSVVQAAVNEAMERIVGDGGASRLAKLRGDMDQLDNELTRLVAAIAQGGESTTLTAEIRKREARREALHAELQVSTHQAERASWSKPRVRRDLERRIRDWRRLLRCRTAQGRQILQTLIDGRLLLTAHADQAPGCYTFEGTGSLVGLLAGIVPHKLASPTGFEPVSQP
jgi:DNA invertase Pin-like site-specific DNA recombinase